MIKKILLICLVCLPPIILLPLAVEKASGSAWLDNQVFITIHNPYPMSVEIEVKCDWNNKDRKFDIYRRFTVLAENRFKFYIPKTVYDCEVWPKIK